MTHPIAVARRGLIARHGVSVTLRRQTAVTPTPTYTSVALLAVFHDQTPGTLRDGWREGDRIAEILTDEITAAAWPTPPAALDTLVTPDGTLTVVGPATPVRLAGALCGWRLHVRGP